MVASEKFKCIKSQRAVAHIHTTFTDGFNSIEEFCRWASEHNIEKLVFTEHVRKQLLFDFDQYVQDIDTAKSQFPTLNIWTGVEVKLLPGGELDIPDDIISEIQVLYFACHTFPHDKNQYRASFAKLFREPKWKAFPRVWAHPGIFFKNHEASDENTDIMTWLIETAIVEDILIENNLRYNLPLDYILATVSPSNVVTGYDAHSIEAIVEIENNLKTL